MSSSSSDARNTRESSAEVAAVRVTVAVIDWAERLWPGRLLLDRQRLTDTTRRDENDEYDISDEEEPIPEAGQPLDEEVLRDFRRRHKEPTDAELFLPESRLFRGAVPTRPKKKASTAKIKAAPKVTAVVPPVPAPAPEPEPTQPTPAPKPKTPSPPASPVPSNEPAAPPPKFQPVVSISADLSSDVSFAWETETPIDSPSSGSVSAPAAVEESAATEIPASVTSPARLPVIAENPVDDAPSPTVSEALPAPTPPQPTPTPPAPAPTPSSPLALVAQLTASIKSLPTIATPELRRPASIPAPAPAPRVPAPTPARIPEAIPPVLKPSATFEKPPLPKVSVPAISVVAPSAAPVTPASPGVIRRPYSYVGVLGGVLGIGISPGRLDVLGGTTEHSGTLVLQTPLAHVHTRVTMRYAPLADLDHYQQPPSVDATPKPATLAAPVPSLHSVLFRTGSLNSNDAAGGDDAEGVTDDWLLCNAQPFWAAVRRSWAQQLLLAGDTVPPPPLTDAQASELESAFAFETARLCDEARVPQWARYVWTSVVSAIRVLSPACEFLPQPLLACYLRVEVRSNVPQRQGLGSSSALVVATMRATQDFSNQCQFLLARLAALQAARAATAAAAAAAQATSVGTPASSPPPPSSPAAIETADPNRYDFVSLSLARTSRAVETSVGGGGAPCGVKDSLVVAHGQPGALTPVLCRPDQLLPSLQLPDGVVFVGWPSGVSRAPTNANAADTLRTAALMGSVIFARSLLSVAPRSRPVYEYVSDLSPVLLRRALKPPSRRSLLDDLPVHMFGASFFAMYANQDQDDDDDQQQQHRLERDMLTRVDFATNYPVRAAFTLPCEEHQRSQRVIQLLTVLSAHEVDSADPAVDLVLHELGSLLYASHDESAAMGLGDPVTDEMMSQVKQLATRRTDVFGARLSSTGGTLVILCRTTALDALRTLCNQMATSRHLDLIM